MPATTSLDVEEGKAPAASRDLPNEGLVRLTRVAVRYKSRFDITRDIGPVSFEVRSGELTYLPGPNGCGKSTILRCIAELEQFEGQVYRAARNITLLPQKSSDLLFPWLTLGDHVAAFGADERSAHLESLRTYLGRLDWPRDKALESTTAGMLSGGLQQLFSLAFVLANPGTDLFLLDEPISALDVHRRKIAERLIEERILEKPEIGILITSHLPLDQIRTRTIRCFE